VQLLKARNRHHEEVILALRAAEIDEDIRLPALNRTYKGVRMALGAAESDEDVRLPAPNRDRKGVDITGVINGCWQTIVEPVEPRASASGPAGRYCTPHHATKHLKLESLAERDRSKTLSGAREVLLQGSFYEVSLALVGVASLAYFQY